MEEKVKEAISAILAENELLKNGRDYVLLLELEHKIFEEARKEINSVIFRMKQKGEIRTGRTINDTYIEIKI